MLPKILEVAEKHGVEFDPRTYGKKETLAKCPFCLEDSNKKGKYYLSLNTHDQVYRCFFCNKKGGVLDFESKLSGVPYHEVKEKYFGENRRNVHPAERLNPSQLECIGWKSNRGSKDEFKKQKDLVYQHWLRYEHSQLTELFAELMVMAYLEDQVERQVGLLNYLKERCETSQIYSCYARIMDEYKKDPALRTDWAVEGVKVARIAWKVSRDQNDSDFSKVVLQVPFIHFLYKKERDGIGSDKTAVGS